MRALICYGVLLTSATAWLPATGAAAEPPNASVSGIVMAADGARLPGVSLLLIDERSGAAVRAVSTDAGVFRIGDTPAGRYSLDAEIDGFEPRSISGIIVAEGQAVSITLRLDVATVREIVRVVGGAQRNSVETLAIRKSGARDVGEALTALPGVVKLRKGAIANDVVLRGLHGPDVTVLIDGQRVDGACPGQMDPPAFHVDFAEVGRIDVSKGPFDVKNQGGLGGIVNVVTERPQRGWHGSGNLMAGSAATLAASAVGSVGAEQLSALGGVSTRRADPYRDGAGVSLTGRANYRQDLADTLQAYGVWTAWGRLFIAPRAGTSVNLSYTRQSAGTMAYPYLQMDALFDHADRAGARFEMADLPGGWGALTAHAYYTRVEHGMTDEYRITSRGMARPYSMGTDAGTRVVGARAEIQRGPVSIGAEASRRRWNSRTVLAMRQYAPQAPLPDATIDVAGGFVTVSADVGSRWHLESGARLDRAASDVDRSIANLALYAAYAGTTDTRATDLLPVGFLRSTWQLHGGWTTTVGVGHGARVPNQQERYYALQRMGTDWVGNPQLTPSRNTSLDAELRRSWRGIDVGVAGYAYLIDDHVLLVDRTRLRSVPGIMNAAARSYANVDALVRGVETTAAAALGPQLFLSADGSWTRGTTRETAGAGRNLPEIPPARGRVRLRFDNARWNAEAEVVASARQDQIAANLGEPPTPAFAVINLRGGLRLRRFDATAGVENLLDTLYGEHLSYQRDPFRSGSRVYEPGRTLGVNVTARF